MILRRRYLRVASLIVIRMLATQRAHTMCDRIKVLVKRLLTRVMLFSLETSLTMRSTQSFVVGVQIQRTPLRRLGPLKSHDQ